MKIKRIWIVIAAAAVVLLIGVVALKSLANPDAYRGRIEAALSQSLGRPVQLGDLEASILSGSLVAADLSIADDPAFSNQAFLVARDIRVGVELGPLLFHHELRITGFTIDQPKIALVRAENGTWNYSSLGATGKSSAPPPGAANPLPNLTVNHLDIQGGTLTVATLPAIGQPRVYNELDITAQNFSFANAFDFTVKAKLPDDGSLQLQGNAGPINQHDAALTPWTAQVSLKHADLDAAGLVDSSQGISGVADLDAHVVSNGQSAQADGTLSLTHLKLAKNGTPSSQGADVKFSLDQDLRSLAGNVKEIGVRIGKAALNVTGAYQTTGNTTTTQMKIEGHDMPIDDLVAFLPALGVQLPAGSRLQGGTLAVALDLSGPVAAPVVAGPVRAANTQLAGFDLGQKLSSIETLTGAKTGSATTIQTLSTNLRYAPDGIRTDNLDAVVTGLGSASGSGSISPAGALDYHLLVKLGGGVGSVASQAVGLLSGALGPAAGQSASGGIPVTIGGTTSSPTFTPDMSKVAGGVLQKKNLQPNSLGKALGGLLHR